MKRKKLGLNKYQKRAFRIGEARVNGESIGRLIDLSRSPNPVDRETAARFLCPCHVRRRRQDVWDALYRMLEDPDRRVRKAAWHTLEDGGRPDDPALDSIFERAAQEDSEKGIRLQAGAYLKARRGSADAALQADAEAGYRIRGKCDFCGESDLPVRRDYGNPLSFGGEARPALLCEACDRPQDR